MRRDPLNRDTSQFPSDNASDFLETDDLDPVDAVNDEHYSRSRSNKNDTLRARRRVEALLEERRLRKALDDGWDTDED
ncbi:PA3496 family putative envelope integrity protein [Halomonas sp. LS-001]